ncbi:MAG: heme ABC transporter ATP-binding protein [Pseudomonadota bacterium]
MSLVLNQGSFRVADAGLLQDVSIEIKPGQLAVIAGPNGAGKSTALKLLSGDLSPSAGSVEIIGRPLSDYSSIDLAKQRAVMPQTAKLAFGLKVWELVQTGRAPHGENDQVAQNQVQSALERVGAVNLAGRDVSTLSGGERQRVFLAKALCQVMDQTSAYLLLDEPTSALDLKQSQRVLRILREAADDGLGVCVILHDLAAAKRYADIVHLFANGRLHTSGAPGMALTPQTIADVYEVPPDIAMDALGAPMLMAAE